MVEDLGGGLKAEAFMGIRLRGREVNPDSPTASTQIATQDQADGIGARDSRITLSGGFGSVIVGAVASGSGILARGTAGQAGYNGLDSDTFLLIDPEVNGVDLFQYTTPTMSGVNAYIQVVDSIGNPGAGGLETAAKSSSAMVYGLNYANGPLSANIDTTSYKRNDVANAVNWTTAAATADSRVRMSAQYDLGVAKVGFGYQTNDNTTTDAKQSIFGVSVPFGALSIGAAIAQRDTKTLATGASVKNKGYEIVANYDLSKRTSIAASIRSVNEGDKAFDAKATRVRLMHAF
jgi:predicted porin